MNISQVLSGLKFNYLKEDDSKLGKVDFGVLTVAMMIAALDGTIQPSELAAFQKLSRQCRVGEGEMAFRYEMALHSAGYILLVSRSGLSKKAIVQTFLREAERVLPMGFAGGKIEDVRRALVLWVSMGLSDGEFSGIERACVEAFCARVSEIMQKRSAKRKQRLWLGLCPGSLAIKSQEARTSVNGDETTVGLMAKAEQVIATGNLAAMRRFIVNG